MRQKRLDMCHGPMLRPMLSYALPIFSASILQRLFIAIDMILASHLGTSGSDAIAAVGSTTSLTSLLLGFFIGCSTGSAVSVSHALGSGNRTLTQKTVHTAMLLSIVIGAMMMITGLCISKAVLTAMGTPAYVLNLSTAYLNMYFTGMIPSMVYNFGAAILRAAGETKKPLFFLLISGPAKILMTVLFVSVCKMDVVGLALANTLSQVISATLVVIALIRRTDDCKLRLKELRFHPGPVKKILALGIPSGIQSATFSLSNVIIQSSVNSLSHLEGFITGNSAATSIEGFAEAITGAFHAVALNFAGQNTGAKNYNRVRRSCFTACALCSACILIASPLALLLDDQLLALYIPDSPQAIYWGTVRMTFIFGPLLFQGFMDTMGGTIRGVGASFSGMIINLLGICGFRILWLLTVFPVPQYHTPQCLYIVYPISWILTTIAQILLLTVVLRKKRAALQKATA